MLHRSSPIRFLLTILLVVAVPLCCCDLRSLLGGCASCEAAPDKDGAETVSHDHADVTTHEHGACHQHATGHAAESADTHSRPPCNPENDKHDCDCGKNNSKMLTVEKSTVELPAPVIVATLDWTHVAELVPTAVSRAHYRDASAIARPPTSLLRQHCALIV